MIQSWKIYTFHINFPIYWMPLLMVVSNQTVSTFRVNQWFLFFFKYPQGICCTIFLSIIFSQLFAKCCSMKVFQSAHTVWMGQLWGAWVFFGSYWYKHCKFYDDISLCPGIYWYLCYFRFKVLFLLLGLIPLIISFISFLNVLFAWGISVPKVMLVMLVEICKLVFLFEN